METRTQSSISKPKGARYFTTTTPCQFGQLFLAQDLDVTIGEEAGKKIR